MPTHTFHFLNVKDGDCSVIEHGSGRVTVVDVCNARKPSEQKAMSFSELYYLEKSAQELFEASGARKNYGQKKSPENPIEYLHKFGIYSFHRFVATHPDMDHLDGIKDLFDEFGPANFWDTDNEKKMGNNWSNSPYREEDWKFYKNLRDGKPQSDPKRLAMYSGDRGTYWTQDENGEGPGDALYILAPTPELLATANERGEDYNDASYVLLYRGAAGRILLSGDSHDDTWDHLLENHEEAIKDVDLLIAPHHGRKSGRSYKFLDTVNPKMTFFGNARAEHLAYSAWRNRNLEFITNNQAGSMIVDCGGDALSVYVTNETFAKDRNAGAFYSDTYKGWFLKDITGWDLKEEANAAAAAILRKLLS